MHIEHRLRKLESLDPNRHWSSVVQLTVEEHESEEEAIRRHFGEDGPPENALLIVRNIVSPPSPPDIR